MEIRKKKKQRPHNVTLSEKGRVESSTATGDELAETRADKNIGNCESQRKTGNESEAALEERHHTGFTVSIKMYKNIKDVNKCEGPAVFLSYNMMLEKSMWTNFVLINNRGMRQIKCQKGPDQISASADRADKDARA